MVTYGRRREEKPEDAEVGEDAEGSGDDEEEDGNGEDDIGDRRRHVIQWILIVITARHAVAVVVVVVPDSQTWTCRGIHSKSAKEKKNILSRILIFFHNKSLFLFQCILQYLI